MTKIYDLGDTVRVSAVITDATGATTDPTTIACKVKNPAGNVSTPTVTKDSVGNYHADVAIGTAAAGEGEWFYRFEATGTIAGAAEGKFKVRDSKFY